MKWWVPLLVCAWGSLFKVKAFEDGIEVVRVSE